MTSLRTSAWEATGVPDRFSLRHGRWSIVSAKDGYVKISVCLFLRL